MEPDVMIVDQREPSGTSEALSDSQWRPWQGRWPVRRRSGSFTDISSTSALTALMGIPFGERTLVILGPPPRWSSDLLARISELGDLEEDWDSYGARPVDPHCAVATVNLLFSALDSTTPKPSIVPTTRGGIQLEWHRAGANLEIEIESPSRFHVFFEDEQAGEETEVTLTGNLEPLVPLLERLKVAP